jgi:hypothetical protein
MNRRKALKLSSMGWAGERKHKDLQSWNSREPVEVRNILRFAYADEVYANKSDLMRAKSVQDLRWFLPQCGTG